MPTVVDVRQANTACTSAKDGFKMHASTVPSVSRLAGVTAKRLLAKSLHASHAAIVSSGTRPRARNL